MSNKLLSLKFAQIFPTGTIAMMCGIGALVTLFQDLTIACLIGIVGVSIGILTMRMRVERSDKIFAVIGIMLSLVPMIYAIIIWVRR